METIGSQQPQHHLPMGLLCFQKEVLAATNAAQQKALTCPLNAKPTLGTFYMSAAPGDSCSGVLFPKSCGRHCVSVWDVYVHQSTTWQFLHRGDAQRDWGRIWTQTSNATILWGSTLLDADLSSSCHNRGSSIALSAPFILFRILAKGQGAIISIHSRKTKADRWPG